MASTRSKVVPKRRRHRQADAGQRSQGGKGDGAHGYHHPAGEHLVRAEELELAELVNAGEGGAHGQGRLDGAAGEGDGDEAAQGWRDVAGPEEGPFQERYGEVGPELGHGRQDEPLPAELAEEGPGSGELARFARQDPDGEAEEGKAGDDAERSPKAGEVPLGQPSHWGIFAPDRRLQG